MRQMMQRRLAEDEVERSVPVGGEVEGVAGDIGKPRQLFEPLFDLRAERRV